MASDELRKKFNIKRKKYEKNWKEKLKNKDCIKKKTYSKTVIEINLTVVSITYLSRLNNLIKEKKKQVE